MKPSNLKYDVYTELKERILSFSFSPGERISDAKIAMELGISRSPVREALNSLAGEGLVQAIKNRGFRVKEFTLKEIEDIYTLRENLEVLAVQLATNKMDEEMIKEMRSLMKRYPALIESKDLVGLNLVDEEFHANIARYSDNQFLEKNLKDQHGQIRIIRRYEHIQAGSPMETYEEHMEILNHIISGDIEAAQSAMSMHIAGSKKAILSRIRMSVE